MHNVIRSSRVLDITTIYVHSILNLTDPSIVANLHRIHVGGGHVGQTIQYRIEFYCAIERRQEFKFLLMLDIC